MEGCSHSQCVRSLDVAWFASRPLSTALFASDAAAAAFTAVAAAVAAVAVLAVLAVIAYLLQKALSAACATASLARGLARVAGRARASSARDATQADSGCLAAVHHGRGLLHLAATLARPTIRTAAFAAVERMVRGTARALRRAPRRDAAGLELLGPSGTRGASAAVCAAAASRLPHRGEQQRPLASAHSVAPDAVAHGARVHDRPGVSEPSELSELAPSRHALAVAASRR